MQKEKFEFTTQEDKNNIKSITEWYKKIEEIAPEEMDVFFEARLNGYDEHMQKHFDIYDHLPSILPGDCITLLDLGCGTGLELDEIFKVYPDINVTGIDLTQKMLDELSIKFSDKNITLFCGDYFEIDFGKKPYDAVISVQSLHHFLHLKKKEMYSKIYLALKSGGVYIESDYTASSEEHEKLCLDFYEKQRDKFKIPPDKFIHIDIPMTLHHRKELMISAGFSRIETVFKSDNTVTTVAYK